MLSMKENKTRLDTIQSLEGPLKIIDSKISQEGNLRECLGKQEKKGTITNQDIISKTNQISIADDKREVRIK